MKKLFSGLSLLLALAATAQTGEILVTMDLVNVADDKVSVTVNAPKITSDKITYHIPKIIPGTYSEDDYGKFIDDFRALDKKGKELKVEKLDKNSWQILGAKNLAKISYKVNDTYDVEGTHDIFSPAGINILAGENFMLNMHGFVGYFADMKDLAYKIDIAHPASLWGATSLADADPSDSRDVFQAARYAELVDNPIMYAKPDYTTFTVDDMTILISVYSPTGKVKAADITPDLEKMMRAQKKFLGPINNNRKYTVLLYLSNMQKDDAKGFGALEHNTSTTVLFPEMMPREALASSLIDVVSHEFFHIVTPLGVHSKEIHYFDFNQPKMSKHLWMYEGVTEYFANLFQVNQGLITEDDFYKRMSAKIANANSMNDTMPFTEMSANVLTEPYKSQYLNVYEKGALIGMCLDILIREKSGGEKGVLDLMQDLTHLYGPNRPFDDEELFGRIVLQTYPEVGEFLNTYVAGPNPIPYDRFFEKMGVTKAKIKIPANPFVAGQTPFITIKPGTKDIMIPTGMELNAFLKNVGVRGGDVIKSVNGKAYTLDNVYELVMGAQEWKEGSEANFVVDRDGKQVELKGKVILEYQETEGLKATDPAKEKLKNAWLKG